MSRYSPRSMRHRPRLAKTLVAERRALRDAEADALDARRERRLHDFDFRMVLLDRQDVFSAYAVGDVDRACLELSQERRVLVDDRPLHLVDVGQVALVDLEGGAALVGVADAGVELGDVPGPAADRRPLQVEDVGVEPFLGNDEERPGCHAAQQRHNDGVRLVELDDHGTRVRCGNRSDRRLWINLGPEVGALVAHRLVALEARDDVIGVDSPAVDRRDGMEGGLGVDLRRNRQLVRRDLP